ncbi:MAG: hypothetical protein ACXVGB_00255 [Mycobacteriaceae bacterium]
MRPDSIVGYVYRADIWCESCIIPAMTGPGDAYDGWALAAGAQPEPIEQQLDIIADAFGIDRYDEWTFDTDDFPKVLFADHASEDGEWCASCHEPLEY